MGKEEMQIVNGLGGGGGRNQVTEGTGGARGEQKSGLQRVKKFGNRTELGGHYFLEGGGKGGGGFRPTQVLSPWAYEERDL